MPAPGLLLGQLLHNHGIDNLILEQRSGEYVPSPTRAGLIEAGTVDLLDRPGVGVARLYREGPPADHSVSGDPAL